MAPQSTIQTTLNEYEIAYVLHGYELPSGVTWAMVHEKRREYCFEGALVPLANVHGVACGWGIPGKGEPGYCPDGHCAAAITGVC